LLNSFQERLTPDLSFPHLFKPRKYFWARYRGFKCSLVWVLSSRKVLKRSLANFFWKQFPRLFLDITLHQEEVILIVYLHLIFAWPLNCFFGQIPMMDNLHEWDMLEKWWMSGVFGVFLGWIWVWLSSRQGLLHNPSTLTLFSTKLINLTFKDSNYLK